jgi:hypothetical protein
VKELKYIHSDINRYHFWTVKLEVSHPLATRTNSGVVTSDEVATGHVTDYYGILQEEIEVHQNFTVSDGAGLAALATGDAELLDEEASPSKKHLQKSKCLLEK